MLILYINAISLAFMIVKGLPDSYVQFIHVTNDLLAMSSLAYFKLKF